MEFRLLITYLFIIWLEAWPLTVTSLPLVTAPETPQNNTADLDIAKAEEIAEQDVQTYSDEESLSQTVDVNKLIQTVATFVHEEANRFSNALSKLAECRNKLVMLVMSDDQINEDVTSNDISQNQYNQPPSTVSRPEQFNFSTTGSFDLL